MAAASVYKYTDAHGVLIYVGITSTGITRNRQHNADKVWWPFVTGQDVEHFDSREVAHAREVELIRKFRPPFNTQHNPDFRDLRAAYIGLQQSGRLGLSAKELALSSKKRIQLHLVSAVGNDAEFLTHIEDKGIVTCLRILPRVKAYLNGNFVGWVRNKVPMEGAVGRITVSMLGDVVPVFAAATGKISYTRLKSPEIVDLVSVILESK